MTDEKLAEALEPFKRDQKEAMKGALMWIGGSKIEEKLENALKQLKP